jgi:tetratricopeptide (TPR) repeat protein
MIRVIPVVGQQVAVQDGDTLDLYFQAIDQNQLDSAEFYLKTVLKSDPAGPLNPLLLNNLGTVQRRRGEWDEALISYSAALGQYPRNPLILENRASLFAEMGKTENAILDYSTLLEVKPDDPEALYQQGLLYLQLKNSDRAEADFKRMLELNPNGLYARIGFAALAKLRGDYPEAEKIYNYLLDKEPENAGLYAGRAELYLLMEKPGKAASDATQAIRLSKTEDPYMYVIRYRANKMLRDKKFALKDLEKARSLGYNGKE